MNINNIILSVVIVGLTGLIFGCLLAFASVVFAVKVDEREEKILELLPGANCGGCGFAGCSACGSAIVKGEAEVNACPVSSDEVISKISDIMGVEPKKAKPIYAKVMCNGTCDASITKYDYDGPKNCVAASRLGGGQKMCKNGCLGFGTCVEACMFDAIKVENGVAKIDKSKCKACGMCVNACPKHLIQFVPKESDTFVLCANVEKGAVVNKYCSNGCIGCKLCEKNCPNDAIHIVNNHAVIDYAKCTNCGLCSTKCPKKVITLKNENEEN